LSPPINAFIVAVNSDSWRMTRIRTKHRIPFTTVGPCERLRSRSGVPEEHADPSATRFESRGFKPDSRRNLSREMAYETALNDALRRIRSRWNGDDLLATWTSWVEDCEDGYAFTAYEYDAELSVRDVVEEALNDPTLATYPEHEAFRNRVAEIDQRFRAVLHPTWRIPRAPPEWASWWRMGILRRAGRQYAEYWRELGFDVEVV